MPEFTITLTDSPDPADVEVVKQGLDSYDASQGAVVNRVPPALFARNNEGVIIAGLTGSTYWGYLYVGHLLAEAEQEAQRRGCHYGEDDNEIELIPRSLPSEV